MYNSGRGNQAQTVAHNWAHKFEGKFKKDTIAGSLYYEGDIIYSYGNHFPIAKHVIGKNGQAGILMTTKGYSNTTSGHISCVKGAISHLTVIEAQNVPSGNWSIDHNSNFEAWAKEIKQIALSLPNAKKPEKYISQIDSVLEQVRKYSEFFGAKPKAEHAKVFKMPIEKLTKMSEADAQKIRERKAEAKEYAKKQAEENEKREIERAKEQLIKFRNFETDNIYTRGHSNTAYLRYNAKTKRIETSKGIEIPVEMGRRFYKWVLTTAKNGGCVGDCKMKILDYEVKAVNKTEFIVGCHTIAFTEAQMISKALNWKL